jgi:proline racemase
MGRVRPGTIRLDTPVGTVTATLHDDGSVSVENVPSRCIARNVVVDVPGVGSIEGDVAYGGNWFFLAELAGAWRQESIIGSLFTGVLHEPDGELIPTIRGRAFVTAEATLLLDDGDPYRYGLA